MESVFDSQSTPSPPLISIEARPTTDNAISDSDESLYQSVDEEILSNDQVCSLNSTSAGISNPISDRQMDVDTPHLQRDELDLAYSIRGMYRILDLISEQGSGGLGEYSTQLIALQITIVDCHQLIRSSYPKIRLRHS